MTRAALTIMTARVPSMLCKTARRQPDGGVRLQPGGMLAEGEARIATVGNLGDLADTLVGLAPNEALIWGIPREGAGRVLSRRRMALDCHPGNGITRTRDAFDWPDGPGIMMLDHDSGETALDREALVALLRAAAPGLRDAAMLWWPSASSHIFDTATGEDLTALRGQRLYLMVREARDIPRAGAALIDRLWALGHGRIVPSVSGSALERTIFDASVWQPERLDFAAGAVSEAGLEQRRGQPTILAGGMAVVDTQAVLADDAEIRQRAKAARLQARKAAGEVLAAARDAYIERRIDDVLSEDERGDPDLRSSARTTLRRAIDLDLLDSAFPIDVEIAPGHTETVTVGRILDDRVSFHGCLTHDPLEPGYDGGRITGKLFLMDARPTLHSFAHGGRTFRLSRSLHRIEIVRGQLRAATDDVLEVLRHDPLIFDHGGQIVVVERGKMISLDEHALAHHFGGLVQFWGLRRSGTAEVPTDLDPPPRIVRQILSLGVRRRLRALNAIVTAATMRPGGILVDQPGFDPETGLLLDAGGAVFPSIPHTPDVETVSGALGQLMLPFADFPFVDSHARGALLAALLTAIVRPTLPTAPAFAIDAPVQGSGKTLLASCIAALATGASPEIWPHTAGRDDEEVRKRLFAALRGGANALVWDNVTGVLDSAALAGAITAPILSDRILGRSESLAIPNRALLILTGNNLCPAGDLPRRLITARIDPGSDAPFAREFALDPLDYVLDHRLELVAAALTILRGRYAAMSERAPGRMASFELWDDVVRQTVAWVGRVVAPGLYGDPLDLVRRAQRDDPEQECLFALLESLADVFPDMWFTARDVVQRVPSGGIGGPGMGDANALAEAISDIAGERALSSSKSLGRVLKFRIGRVVLGRRLLSRRPRNVLEFRVATLPDTPDTPGAPDAPEGRFDRFDRFDRFESGDPEKSQMQRPETEAGTPGSAEPEPDDDPFRADAWK